MPGDVYTSQQTTVPSVSPNTTENPVNFNNCHMFILFVWLFILFSVHHITVCKPVKIHVKINSVLFCLKAGSLHIIGTVHCKYHMCCKLKTRMDYFPCEYVYPVMFQIWLPIFIIRIHAMIYLYSEKSLCLHLNFMFFSRRQYC